MSSDEKNEIIDKLAKALWMNYVNGRLDGHDGKEILNPTAFINKAIAFHDDVIREKQAAPDLYEENKVLRARVENLQFYLKREEAQRKQIEAQFSRQLSDCLEFISGLDDLERQVNQLGEALREAVHYAGWNQQMSDISEIIAHALNDSGQWRASK